MSDEVAEAAKNNLLAGAVDAAALLQQKGVNSVLDHDDVISKLLDQRMWLLEQVATNEDADWLTSLVDTTDALITTILRPS